MKFKGLVMGLALALGSVMPVAAQDIVGRALVEGKMVEILSDRTWRFQGESGAPATSSNSGGANCKSIHAAVTFCADPNLWTSSPPANADIVAAYKHDDRHYGQFIVETFGAKDGVTATLMRDIVVQNASAATGQRKEEIVILGIDPVQLDGVPAETVVYLVEFDGLKVVFSNTIMIQDSLTMQAITYAVSPDFSEKHQGLHKVLLDNTKLN